MRLRFRVLANTLTRSPLQLVAVVVGGVPVVLVLAAALAGSAALSHAPVEVSSLVIVGLGSLLVIGWIVGPLLIDGVDDSLDPVRLARFPLRAGELMAATVVGTVQWIPGAATLMAVGVGGGDIVGPLVEVVRALTWTPVGAAWAIPGRVALGDTVGAVMATAIAVATLAAALLIWRLCLSRVAAGGGTAARAASASPLGIIGAARGPATAVAVRSLVYWFRDARRARQLLLIPAVPLMVLLWARLLDSEPLALAIGPIVACLVPLSAFAELSYDGTAFTAHVAAGIPGRGDRAGRAASLTAITVPATALVVVGVALVIGRLDTVPAMLGLSLCVALVAIGVVAVSSAWFVVPVPRAGRNPFAAPPGGIALSMAASYGVLFATVLIVAPVAALAVFAVAAGAAPAGWVALVLGPVVGAAAVAGGVVLGGRILDATAPETLARLRALRG